MLPNNIARKEALEAMNFDPVQYAEDLFGKVWDKSPKTFWVGLLFMQLHRERMESLMGNLGDTYFSISWAEFLKIIEKYGFQTIKKYRFNYGTICPEHLIAAHPEKFLILCAHSYPLTSGPESLSGGDVYGMLKPKNGQIGRTEWLDLKHCSHSHSFFGREFNYDVREGLISRLECLGETFKYVRWHDPDPFLYLLDYVQEQTKDSDSWRKCRDEFIATAPKWVQDFILPDKTHQVLRAGHRIKAKILNFVFTLRRKIDSSIWEFQNRELLRQIDTEHQESP
jgi:hypothetical protein